MFFEDKVCDIQQIKNTMETFAEMVIIEKADIIQKITVGYQGSAIYCILQLF